jgi:hypothetical protein
MEDNIKVNIYEVGWKIIDWIYLAQDRERWRELVSAVRKIQVA